MSDRMLKIDELVRERLGRIIAREVELPIGALATIVKVATAPNLKETKVFVSVLPVAKSEVVIKVLNRERANLQHWLGRQIKIRQTPILKFFVDDTAEQAAAIDQLLDNLK